MDQMALPAEEPLLKRAAEVKVAQYSDASEAPPSSNCATLAERLGTFNIFLLSTSAVAGAGSLTFILFLWIAGQDNPVWREIVLSGWTVRSITISALVLRWSATTQAAVCSSLLAALLLRNFMVFLPKAAAVSMSRFQSPGPWSLLGILWRGVPLRASPLALLTLLLGLTTLLIQFTSTVLLSNVGPGLLPVSSDGELVRYGYQPIAVDYFGGAATTMQTVDLLKTNPPLYPMFAEYVPQESRSNTSNEVAPSASPGIKDTGTVMRAFLPIDSQSRRERLVAYDGPASVVDTRVACVRPRFKDGIHVDENSNIRGAVGPEFHPDRFLAEEPTVYYDNGTEIYDVVNYQDFKCGLSVKWTGGTPVGSSSWPLTLCVLDGIVGGNIGIVSSMEHLKYSGIGQSFLLVNATGVDGKHAASNFTASLDLEQSEWLTAQAGPYLFPSGPPTYIILQMTVCYTAFRSQDLNISASRFTYHSPEPTIGWNHTTRAHITEPILRQMGAYSSSGSVDERDTLKIKQRKWFFPPNAFLTDGHDSVSLFSPMEVLQEVYKYRSLNLDLPGDGGTSVSLAQASVFSDMLKTTKNPALAVQSMFTTLFSMFYYAHSFQFDLAAPANLTLTREIVRPDSWSLCAAVLGVYGFHSILVLVVLIAFHAFGALNLVGNAWSAMCQIKGSETDGWVRLSDMSTDDDVRQWMKKAAKDKEVVGIQTLDGRVQLVRRANR